MKYCCPDHIDGLCQPVIDESPFREIRDKFSNQHHLVYQVKCDCGCYVFRMVCDKNPTVVAVCPNCGRKITVFDQAEYTTGSPREALEGILLKTNGGNDLFEVCVMYEYGELYDPERPFDFNDVSWGTVWAMDEQGRKITMVIDKETE